MPDNPHINNYLRTGNILDRERNLDRKYFDWKIIHFSLRQRGDIEKKLKKFEKFFFDWMGMNEKIFNRSILNLEFWLFPEFVLLYNVYKIKPWIILSKFLLFNLTTNKNISQNKNQNQNFFLPSNKTIKIKNRSQNIYILTSILYFYFLFDGRKKF
uniref:Uncharacterized protein n=1 Tax=Solanum lycopersicum TaxID=4081 RepID=K4AV02_SOLLC